MSAAQLFVLRTVAAEPGIAVGELAARTHTRQSTVSEVVARLADRGLVERRADAADARRRTLHLTAAARALVRTARRTVPERLVTALDALPPAERAALARGLERWVTAAGLDVVEPTMFFEARSRAR
ncbi:MAG TPA: MarR family winged helix-turn-helix transcriptional regulator [Gemmatirosa sp.]